ncbi:hypothetical protein N431DRAFT_467203 [Stipitochalara longipes BDJ]|nr:hypothetical protein N431DRAFT_467203 [Stipitochalara longipes BDJ]
MQLVYLHFLGTIVCATVCWGVITNAPVAATTGVQRALAKRVSGATCGYINGQSESPLACPSGSIYNTVLHAPTAACCDPSSCTYGFYGICYEYGTWESVSDSLDNGGTSWHGCDKTDICVTYIIQGTSTSNTFITCTPGSGGVVKVLATPTTQTSASTAAPSTTPDSTSSTLSNFSIPSTSDRSISLSITHFSSSGIKTIAANPTASPSATASKGLSSDAIIGIVFGIVTTVGVIIAWRQLRHMRKERREQRKAEHIQLVDR